MQWQWGTEGPSPALARFVLLSMLLHATIVVLFGTSHGGGFGRGERGRDDVLDVTLRRQLTVPDVGLRAGPGNGSSAGRDPLRRADEPPQTPAPPQKPPAPAIGPGRTDAPIAAEPAPAVSRESVRAPPPTPVPAVEPLPRIDWAAPQEVDRPLAPPLLAPPVMQRLGPPANPPALAAPVEPAPAAIPAIPAAPIERLAAPAAQHELAPPVEFPPRVTPAIPEAPIERLAPPAAQHELASPLELTPRVAPFVPAPLDRLTAPRIEPQLEPAPTLAAPAAAAPSDTAPSSIERAAPPSAPAPPSGVPAQGPAPDASAAPKADAELPRLRLGAPAGDDDIFKPRRDAGAIPGDGAPALDLDAARKRAREIASEATGTRGILPALPPPPERKSKESIALEKAIKPDCRTAYAGMGLLAVPALVASTIGDGGCRW